MRTWIELDSEALDHNLKMLRHIWPGKMGFVLKSNAYGHGIVPMLEHLCKRGNPGDYVCVAHAEEACAVRKGGWKEALLILAYVEEKDIFYLKHLNAECVLFSQESFALFDQWTRTHRIRMNVHIKINTGMNRLGIEIHELEELLQKLCRHPYLHVNGLLSHCFDSAAYSTVATEEQTQLFEHGKKLCSTYFPSLTTHIYASGSCSLPPRHTMVRCGSALYGFYKSREHQERLAVTHSSVNYLQILSWKTKIMQVRNVQAGSHVGYGTDSTVKRDTLVSILPVGYSDGYPRDLSHKAGVLLDGHYSPLCGSVSMDLMAIDVTDIPHVHVGQEVTLTSCDPRISLSEWARQLDSLPFTLSAGLASRIPRFLGKPETGLCKI